jgi:hypothetical protein
MNDEWSHSDPAESGLLALRSPQVVLVKTGSISDISPIVDQWIRPGLPRQHHSEQVGLSMWRLIGSFTKKKRVMY